MWCVTGEMVSGEHLSRKASAAGEVQRTPGVGSKVLTANASVNAASGLQQRAQRPAVSMEGSVFILYQGFF